MKSIRVISWVLCAAPIALAANGGANPAMRLAADRATSDNRGSSGSGAGLRAQRGNLSDADLKLIQEWMAQHCRNRLSAFARLSPNEQQQGLQLVLQHYRQIQQVNFAPLRKAMIEQVEAEDLVFGAQIQARQAKGDPEKLAVARDNLHIAVEALVKAEINQRQVRIDRLQKEIDDLTRDQDKVVSRMVLNKLRQAGVGRGESRLASPPPPATEESPPDDVH